VIEVDTATTSVSEVVQRTLASVQIHDLSIEDPPLEEIVQAIYEQGRLALTSSRGASRGCEEFP
ncbi:MAG: hypothetical protein AB7I09_20285, partial [Planctomycetota bacterium]